MLTQTNECLFRTDAGEFKKSQTRGQWVATAGCSASVYGTFSLAALSLSTLRSCSSLAVPKGTDFRKDLERIVSDQHGFRGAPAIHHPSTLKFNTTLFAQPCSTCMKSTPLYVGLGCDVSNAFAEEAPPPKDPFYIVVDDQFRDRWENCLGNPSSLSRG
jgi:hypothetical protein